jgi:hypothetical protein
MLSGASLAAAQDARLQINQLDKLEARAAKIVDVTLDDRLLRLAAAFLNSKDANQAKIRELVTGIKGVYVKVFAFDKEGEFSAADVESVRTQLRSPAWSRMVDVRSRRDGQSVEVYSMMAGNQITGMAVIAAEPKQLTIVNIVGPIDIEKLTQLSGNFGIPQIQLSRDGKTPKE